MASPFNPNDQHASIDLKLIALLERLATAMRGSLQAIATEHKLSPIQVEVVLFIRYHEDQGRTGLLADQFQVKQPTMSDALAALEAKGLVIREQSAHDARIKELRLTRAGRAVAKKLEAWVEPYRQALGGLAESDKARAFTTLLDLASRLVDRGVITQNRMCFTCRYFATGSPGEDHFCKLLDIALTPETLRVDCPEHELP